jgi:hypothetical protein
MLLMRTNEKSDRTVEITDPDLACAGVEVEGAPLINLRKSVRAFCDFDADLGRAGKNLSRSRQNQIPADVHLSVVGRSSDQSDA